MAAENIIRAEVNEVVEVAVAASSSIEEQDEQILERFWGALDVFDSTLKTYRRTMRRFMEWIHGHGLSLADVQDYHLKAYKHELEATLQASSVNTYLSPVKRFYRYVSNKTGRPNPAAELKGSRRTGSHSRDALSGKQAQETLDGVRSRSAQGIGALRDCALYTLLLTCGLRTIEAARANICDISQIEGQAVLWVQGKGHSKKDEFVPLSDTALEAVQAYLTARGNPDPAEPLFIVHGHNGHGKRLSTRTISGIAKTTMKAAGIDSPRITAHSLRHTAVTQALLKGATLQEAQAFARHANPQTTEIYAHNLDKLHNPAAAYAADYR